MQSASETVSFDSYNHNSVIDILGFSLTTLIPKMFLEFQYRSIQHGNRKSETHAIVLSPTLAYRNSKNKEGTKTVKHVHSRM